MRRVEDIFDVKSHFKKYQFLFKYIRLNKKKCDTIQQDLRI